jgi:hypothetical protein
MVPTLTATLGVKGHRPVVGTRDCKDLLYVLAVVNLVSAAVHANLVDSPKGATKATGKSKSRRLQEAFAAHLRHVGRVYPSERHKRVVLLIDNAPWHAGESVRQANPHLEGGLAMVAPGQSVRTLLNRKPSKQNYQPDRESGHDKSSDLFFPKGRSLPAWRKIAQRGSHGLATARIVRASQ